MSERSDVVVDMQDSRVPLEAIFREPRKKSAAKVKMAPIAWLEAMVRSRTTLSLADLDILKDRVRRARLSYPELVKFENTVRDRAAASERVSGWHGGFGDLLRHLVELRMRQEGA